MVKTIPVCEPNVGEAEARMVATNVRWGHLNEGNARTIFECEVASLTNAKWAIATVTGSHALFLGFLVQKHLYPTYDVTIPALHFPAAINAALCAGLKPIFVDIDLNKGMHSRWPDAAICGAVLDAAPAIGRSILVSSDKHKMLALSFNANKTITTGQGGMLLGVDQGDYSFAMQLASVGKSFNSPIKYSYDMIGYNLRMANVNAAIGLAQLSKLPKFLRKKENIIRRYIDAGLKMLPSYWMAVAEVDNRSRLIARLRENGVMATDFWGDLRKHPHYADIPSEPCPLTEALDGRLMCLPCGTILKKKQQDKVINLCARCS